MNSNDIPLSPSIAGVASLYRLWKRTHVGLQDDFLTFMSVPSTGRNAFLESVRKHVDHKFISFSIVPIIKL